MNKVYNELKKSEIVEYGPYAFSDDNYITKDIELSINAIKSKHSSNDGEWGKGGNYSECFLCKLKNGTTDLQLMSLLSRIGAIMKNACDEACSMSNTKFYKTAKQYTSSINSSIRKQIVNKYVEGWTTRANPDMYKLPYNDEDVNEQQEIQAEFASHK